ncbi:threonine/serine dehydratase [Labrys monachus]|uniref:Threonine dehydratase n=1 Tax=Labrys monachus TaxID=217067 RepID=A0ABU0F866_9HYPH|nr:threonine/serine dehydratase [Labrys monachus]MDQ0390799.1 threonine dehydratase [Labrys monachus]
MTFLDAIHAADRRIRPVVRETGLEASPPFSERTGQEVLLKLENLQHTGSFKLRGAANKILSLGTPAPDTKVVTASSGNHGAAVAYALRGVGGRGLIFVPNGASPAKVANIRRLGAEVEFVGEDSADTEAHARRYAEERGWPYVPPYNDPDVVAGQGTIAAELLRQGGPIDNVFVSVGGGGLIGGIATYLKAVSPRTRIIGCSPAASCVMARSVEAGEVLDLPSGATLSDGTAGGIEPGTITFALCRDHVDHWIDVDEEEIAEAMRLFIDGHHMLLEGAAGVALAGLCKAGPAWTQGRSVAVICGANISRPVLRSVL